MYSRKKRSLVFSIICSYFISIHVSVFAIENNTTLDSSQSLKDIQAVQSTIN